MAADTAVNPLSSKRPRAPTAQPEALRTLARVVTTGERTETLRRRRLRTVSRTVPAWLISMVVHFLVMLVMTLILVGPDAGRIATVLRISQQEEDLEPVTELALREQVDLDHSLAANPPPASMMQSLAAELPREMADSISALTVVDAGPLPIGLDNLGEQAAPRDDLMATAGALAGDSLQGRSAANRASMLKEFGGTEGSERAVALALRWFAAHQLPDGSWSFDHRTDQCQGQCSHPGKISDCASGATAMAILPFLGAGQTHLEGQYKEQVRRGLAFLVRSMEPNGSLAQGAGNMYAHGLAAIAICEAYAMTQDSELRAPAQATINFIVESQDPVGGGWRYAPRQPGDTSVVGWQLMALKSGHMAYLHVPTATVRGADRFLDSVQANRGANYSYMNSRSPRQTTTSIGLLCRMYLGWKKDHRGLKRGVEYLSKTGPSKGDMYYNYYATQVLRHWEGAEWKKWNDVMRDQLVATQARSGHAVGSWIVDEGDDRGVSQGGRLYCTSLATMILEVYYRHMPLYAKSAAEQDFPLH